MSKIFQRLKSSAIRLVDRYDWYALFSLRKRGYLFDMGWLESRRNNAAIDRRGDAIPWITYPSLTFLRGRIKKEFVVFEYGCGNSTIWWARHCSRVISCEHDENWFNHVSSRVPSNVELKYVSLEYGGAYSRLITQYTNMFDVVFIDGRDRVNCMRNSLAALKRDGVVVFDNSDVTDYEPALKIMSENGFLRIDFDGPGPINTLAWRTSVFYRPGNCLGI